MKKVLFLVIVCAVFYVLNSCDDTLTTVGTTIQPEEDVITLYSDTFALKASTKRIDSVYLRASSVALGELYDPVFGIQKSDFITQFYCNEDFRFTHTPHEGMIDSMILSMSYLSWVGDSLVPMEVSVYQLNSLLNKSALSNINPEEYCNREIKLGTKTYTAYDATVSDSVRNAEISSNYYGLYTSYLSVPLDASLGQKIYDESIQNPAAFSSQSAFNQFFPGIYVTNTFGSGNMLLLNTINMYLYYRYDMKDASGNDSIGYYREVFPVTAEVLRLNHFTNSSIESLLEENALNTYVKSPAGVCTELIIPTTEIAGKLDVNDRYLNNFNLTLHYLPTDDWEYAYEPPGYLLLLPADSLVSFFQNENIEDNVTSFLSYDAGGQTASEALNVGYDANARTYTFGNVSSLLKKHINACPNEDLRLLVVPVERDRGVRSSYSSSSPTFYTIGLQPGLKPSGVRIRTDGDYLKMVVLSSKFENK